MKTYLFVYSLILTLANLSCSKDSSDSGSGDATIGNASETNALATTYPDALAISVFPDSSSTSLALADSSDKENIKEKRKDIDKRLKGTSDSCMDRSIFSSDGASETITCYEFDNDMNPYNNGPSGGGGTTTGKHTTGEACMVAFARQEMSESVNRVERSLALISGMICQAKKSGADTSLPDEGVENEKDFSAALKSAAGDTMPVTEAKMSRLADIDGRAVYRSDVAITDPKGNAMEVHLIHSPGETTANGVKEESRTLWMITPGLAPGQTDPSDNNFANKKRVMSINYTRQEVDGEPRMRFEVRRAAILSSIDPVTAEGLVNFAGIPEGEGNSTSSSFSFTRFDMHPDTNVGSMAYWKNPGGNYNESARGFLFKIEAQADGSLKGCGVSGATGNVSIRQSLTTATTDDELKPVRYWHPFAASNTSADKDSRYNGAREGPYVTVQCYKQNIATGLYEIDTDETAHESGFDVVEQANNTIAPPPEPKEKLDGNFK